MERDAKDYADSIHAIFVETSAKNAININELFIEISEYLCALWVSSVQSNLKQLSCRVEFSPYVEWSSLWYCSQWNEIWEFKSDGGFSYHAVSAGELLPDDCSPSRKNVATE